MSFERIDRLFKPTRIRLECVRCGTTEHVEMLYPLWRQPIPEPVALCCPCSRLVDPAI